MSSYSLPVQTTFTVGSVRAINSGNLKALVSVRFGVLTIEGWRVVQQPGQRAYVAAPSSSYLDRITGRTAYSPLIKIADRDLMTQLQDAILRAWERTTNNSPEPLFDIDEEEVGQ